MIQHNFGNKVVERWSKLSINTIFDFFFFKEKQLNDEILLIRPNSKIGHACNVIETLINRLIKTLTNLS